jgi:hypothetical protein
MARPKLTPEQIAAREAKRNSEIAAGRIERAVARAGLEVWQLTGDGITATVLFSLTGTTTQRIDCSVSVMLAGERARGFAGTMVGDGDIRPALLGAALRDAAGGMLFGPGLGISELADAFAEKETLTMPTFAPLLGVVLEREA